MTNIISRVCEQNYVNLVAHQNSVYDLWKFVDILRRKSISQNVDQFLKNWKTSTKEIQRAPNLPDKVIQ